MKCKHTNPAGYAYCATCGSELNAVRCRCGFIAAAGDAYCGRCGINLSETIAKSGKLVVDADHRLDLVQLAEQAAQEQLVLESTTKVRVNQDDIRRLIGRRRKKL